MAEAVPLTRVLSGVGVLAAGFSLMIAATLPGPLRGAELLAVGLGVVAQIAATAVIAKTGRQPQLGFVAAVTVSSGLVLAGPPWPELLRVGAVAWMPITLGWAAARVLEYARSRAQIVVAVLTGAAYLVVVASRPGARWSGVVVALLPILGAATVMLAIRLRRARRDQLAALARQREADRRDAERAARERLAEEIHDTLGHQLTLMVLRANALKLQTQDPLVQQAGEQLSGFGTAALADLRRLVRLLHQAPDAGMPSTRPGADLSGSDGTENDSVRRLVAEARAVGQQVRLVERGAHTQLTPVTARTVVRVVQEGLTNARRYAPGSEVDVVLAVASEVEVTVFNRPLDATVASAPVSSGSGLGLIALRRRVELLDGSCTAGPSAGGYALRVVLPRTGTTRSDFA